MAYCPRRPRVASQSKYLELHIDVLDRLNQRAQVLPELRPPELVRAILDEFGEELDYLSSDPGDYRLRNVRQDVLLDDQQALADLVREGEHLALEEAAA